MGCRSLRLPFSLPGALIGLVFLATLCIPAAAEAQFKKGRRFSSGRSEEHTSELQSH